MSIIEKILTDQKLKDFDKEIRQKALQAKDEEEERGYRLVHKYIRAYQQWRRKVIVYSALTVITILFLFLLGMGVKGVVGIVKRNIQNSKNEKQTERIETETETEMETETESNLTPSGKEPLAEEVSLTMTFTGDCILGTDEYFYYYTGFTYYYDCFGPDYFLENVRDIFESDDLTIVNMEGTLTEETNREYKEFAFKGDPEYVQILSGSSVEAANLANNHTHDYGEQSFQDTKNILEENHIKTFGYDDVTMINVKGVDVGIYGIYELDDHLERIPQMRTNIQKLKDMGADIIVGIFHWSNELVTFPDENQLEMGHLAIDLGTDIVVGHHPHVIQGMEEYKGKKIVYSLGNFCFGGNTHPTETDTFIYQQTFTVNTDREIVSTEENIIPCWVSSDYVDNNYQPTPMEGEEYAAEMEKIAQRSEGLGQEEETEETIQEESEQQEDGAEVLIGI